MIIMEYPFYIAPWIIIDKEDNNNFSVKCWDDIIQDNIEDFEWLNINTKIIIFETERRWWFIDRAKDIYSPNNFINWKIDENTGNIYWENYYEMIVLMICLAYPEAIQSLKKWKSSNGHSCDFFKEWCTTKNINEDISKKLYYQARCGFFHWWWLKEWFIISYSSLGEIVKEDNGCFKIDLHYFLNCIESDFNDYIIELRKNKDKQNKFERIYNEWLREYFTI